MEKIKLLELLGHSLEGMGEEKEKFKNYLSETVKQDISISFQDKALRILDYIYTNFPVERNKLADYFPRPTVDEDEEKYLIRVRKRTTQLPNEVLLFLKKCFFINKKYNSAISYIRGKVKHERPNEFGKEGKTILNATYCSNYPNPIKTNIDGGIEIAGCIKISTGSITGTRVYGSTFHGPQGTVFIDRLEPLRTPFEGDKIIFDNNKIKFVDWADDCINICNETIEEFEKIKKEK